MIPIPDTVVIKSPADIQPPLSKAGMDVLDIALFGARENFKQLQDVKPVLIAYKDGPPPNIEIYGLSMGDIEEKDQVARVIAHLRQSREAVAFVTEAWMACLKEAQGQPRESALSHWRQAMDQYGSVKDMPERKEILGVTVWDGIRRLMLCAEIVRPEDGSPVLQDWQLANDTLSKDLSGQMEGRFS